MFFGLSYLFKVCQGAGGAAISIGILSFVPFLFPDSVESKIQMLEALSGVGFIAGPLIGTPLYHLGGYQLPFYFCAFMALVFIPFYSNFPSRKQEQEKNFKKEDEKELVYSHIFQKCDILLSMLLIVVVISSYTMLEACLAQFFHSKYLLEQTEINYVFNIIGAYYIFFLLLLNHLDMKKNLVTLFYSATIINGCGMLFIGPDPIISNLFGINDGFI